MTSVNELGQKIANPNQNPTNFFKMAVMCGCDEITPCQDKLEVTLTAIQQGLSIQSIVIDGVTYNLDEPVSTILAKEIGTSIATQFLKVETCVSVCATFDESSSLLTIEHIGQTALESITLSDNTVLTTTRCCVLAINTKYQGFINGTSNVISSNGVDCPLLGDYTYDTPVDPADPADPAVIANNATAATLLSDFESCLTTLGLENTNVSVEVSDNDAGYVVEYFSQDSKKISVGGVDFQNCGASKEFVC